ncbi:hypothetical protein COU05_03740 [bacterium (Candidatus Gribaldobacteria) CG10_big_fil_rev_8_21_14_0_10_37_21]|uniref:RNA polymerase sigma factor n=2 Tax=Candidatus Gribaldobacteria TaxID=2798536 RepID=A0A2H0UV75_9BACT|nr:MAG: hypothetical protein AUJ25_00400 [Parcubacteria group bacterium CG1_02_37_13]PIR89893.1 MAG: hypothetical protein COU05_03740 [bacterium (Candidatus Gribaldobacteria) CG10_big_fil_rev_8_21_14_0_10_37_21]
MRSKQKQFTKIYDNQVEKIYRYVFLKTGNVEIAEDITSQVFVKGWRKFKSLGAVENENAYLFKIAKNEIVDHYRKTTKYKIVSVSNVAEISEEVPTLEEEQQVKSEIKIAKDLLTQLKDDYQDVLILRYVDGYEVPEIALMMDKTEANVRVMMHRALKELRDKMSK